jgi:hypothetical protein
LGSQHLSLSAEEAAALDELLRALQWARERQRNGDMATWWQKSWAKDAKHAKKMWKTGMI